jgi:DNA (cytosine-5)-methyltransferase 1
MENILRIGTDCSGIEAPIQALIQMDIPFRHVFSSDMDKFCIKSIKANFKPEILFGDPEGAYPNGDITKRDINLLPDIDLYVCGFPCTPWSSIGKRDGFDHKSGNVFWSCLDVIRTKQPKYFLLENVKGLLSHNKGKTWDIIWFELTKLAESGYHVNWKILNTRDYGIPHNRERLYILGSKVRMPEWPEKIPMDNLEKYVDFDDIQDDTTSERNKLYLDKFPNCIFVEFNNCSFGNKPPADYCACLTSNMKIWCQPCSRYIKWEEAMKLQGMANIIPAVSNTQLKKQIGNSMSVNVLKYLFEKLLA